MGGPEYARYIQLFHSLCRGSWALSRAQAEPTFSRARLPREDIDAVWALCDTDGDGYLARNEFAVALHIAAARYKGAAMPQQLPPSGGGGGDAEHVHRSGLLSANKSKRWCVLSGGKLDVFDKKADQTKPPKMSLDLRADVSKVARSDLKSFKLELHPGSRHAKAAKSAGGSASLLFSSDDNTEISKWVNDLTKVVSGLHGGH
ncbi:epidermal growth factor receptor pathway substrate 15-like 1 [Emiliania huxleyi CCMP1516]|uniref:PH domain-containing protein n=2 Tax=Emiliania huxleyi TaxID=2903 RepID=A0A0D3JX27_EMIH1|nr:epidermal growth factor receptor pathway substrate 15-like 1 [Emiliania huxleyi CCMP1516]EOD28062.1 epidermal growth factor receptor pathway substrate 15-like 1 [Emiliania huxleyi CCMP1516]|eukprot:XP_005780491.1 epidermal growth factor receptor pathway substrate 15-like 1 [Emiliania huxleyi CCMP1516]